MPRITILEPGKTPQPYRLKIDRELTTIGRGSDNDIVLATGSASTHHCEMKRVEGGFILIDTNSTNGISLEGTRYSVIDLEDGISVHLGDDIELKFELADAEIDTLEEEDFYPRQKAMFPKKKRNKKKQVEPEEKDDDEEEDEKPRKKIIPEDLDLDDDDEDEDEDKNDGKPKLKRASGSSASRPAVRPVASATKKSAGPLGLILYLVFAALFFLAGLAIRHYQEYHVFIFGN